MRNVCVYGSASDRIGNEYFQRTVELSRLLAQRGWGLIFGGGTTGLMGAIARCMLQNGAHITGVIPERLNIENVVFGHCHELVVTNTLRERKQVMEDRADAFIALPGGFGTMEELLEIITLKQLGYHDKPIAVFNAAGYYDGLQQVFDNAIRENFAAARCTQLYCFAGRPEDAVRHIGQSYRKGED